MDAAVNSSRSVKRWLFISLAIVGGHLVLSVVNGILEGPLFGVVAGGLVFPALALEVIAWLVYRARGAKRQVRSLSKWAFSLSISWLLAMLSLMVLLRD